MFERKKNDFYEHVEATSSISKSSILIKTQIIASIDVSINIQEIIEIKNNIVTIDVVSSSTLITIKNMNTRIIILVKIINLIEKMFMNMKIIVIDIQRILSLIIDIMIALKKNRRHRNDRFKNKSEKRDRQYDDERIFKNSRSKYKKKFFFFENRVKFKKMTHSFEKLH